MIVSDKFCIPSKYLEMSVEELREVKQKLYDKTLEEKYKNGNKYIAEINKGRTGGCRQKAIWLD